MIESHKLNLDTLAELSIEQNLPCNVRLATTDDIDKLIPVINTAYMFENKGPRAFKKPDSLRVNEATLREAMNEGFLIVVSKLDEGEEHFLGCVHYKEIPPSEGSGTEQDTNAYFGMLAVDVNTQRQGLGTHLVCMAEAIAAFRGCERIEIQVVDKSTHLLDWYGRLGYQEFGRRDWNSPVLSEPRQLVLMEKIISASR
mgnify:CR=1 FL=1